MEFAILGPLEVRRDEQMVDVRGSKRRGLLAYLLVRSPTPQPLYVIVEAVWGESAGSGAAATVQTYVSQLRKLLSSDPEVRLDTGPTGYAFTFPRDRLDASRFEDLVARASAEGNPDVRLRQLNEALALWRATPLSEFDAEWADVERARLDALRVRALGLRVDVRLERGEHAGLVPELESLVREFPLDEGMWARLMLAYHGCGRQADALRAFADVRRLLATELGIEPASELVELERRVLDDAPGPVRRVEPLPAGIVTFLLTDIEGSTQLWDTKQMEMGEALARHERLIADAVSAHDGRLLKSRGEGDATLSVFTRASDALAAALDLQQQLLASAERHDLILPTRVALHTGEAQLRDGDYYGGTLNRAARIRALAGAGEILCSRATHDVVAEALPPDVSLTRLGEHELRGLRRREDVYAVAHPGLPAPRPRRAALDRRFIARDREVEMLLAAAARVTAGASHVVLVSGEAGIGKTTLVEHVAGFPEVARFSVLWGRCYEHEGAPPFWPWLQILRAGGDERSMAVLAADLGDDVPVLRQLLPELSAMLETDATPPDLDLDAARFRLFEAIVRLLRRAAEREPLMLILDDVHWADQSSLLLLQFAARQLADAPVLFLGTCRTAEARARQPVSETIAELVRLPAALTLALNGFDHAEIANYVESMSDAAVTPRLAQVLYQRTDGNPFFLAESVRLLDQTGALDDESAVQQMPESVRAAIGRRVSQAPEEVRALLEVAAVIGRDFEERVLTRVIDAKPSEIAAALSQAQRAGLTSHVATPVSSHRFVHALVRDAIHDDMTLDRRRELHARVGEALYAVHTRDADQYLEAIAYHFIEAASSIDPGRAVLACERAARHALSLCAYENAASLADQALQLLERGADPPPEQRCDLLLLLGDALERAGDEPRSQAAYVAALSEARELRDGRRMTEAMIGLTWSAWFDVTRADVAQRQAWFDEVLALLPSGDSRTRTQLTAALGEELHGHDLIEERRLAEEAVAMARRLDDDVALAPALSVLAQASCRPGDVQRAAAAEELVAVARRLGDRRWEMWGHDWRFAHALETADRTSLSAALEGLHGLAELHGGRARTTYLFRLVAHATTSGDFTLAERTCEAAAEARSGNPAARTQFVRAQVGVIRLLQGRLDPKPLEQMTPLGTVYDVGWRCALAAVLAQTGRLERAASLLDELAPDDATIQSWPQYPGELFNLAVLAVATAAIGDTGRAETLHDALRPFEQLMVCVGDGITTLGPVAHYLGVLAACLGRHDAAVQDFERAIEIAKRIDGRPFVAMAQAAWADALVGRDEPGDIDRAGQLATDALEVANELGMRLVREQARAIISAVEEQRAIGEARSSLGLPPDVFVGRDDEIDALDEMLSTPGLVTLTGAGGIGKTRLALEVAARVTSHFERTWVVRLAGVLDDDAVVAAVESAVVLRPPDLRDTERPAGAVSEVDRIVSEVGRRRALLVLDNCEHVPHGAVTLVQALIQDCPQLNVVATSRARLGLRGERVFIVPGLADSSSMHLLTDRARASDQRFDPSTAEVSALSQLCAMLDGIPLAIELAAARLASTSAADLLQRLSHQLELLEGSTSTDDRHSTMRAAIAWSYRLLDVREQTLLRRTAVFRGGFTLDAAEQVCSGDELLSAAEVYPSLADLVAKSLVVFEQDCGRYRLLEPIRLYSQRRLDDANEAARLSRRHAAWVQAFARGLLREQIVDEGSAHARLGAETENVEAALASCESVRDDETLLRVIGDLGFPLYASDWRRGLRLAQRATDRSRPVAPRVWARALMTRGMLEQRASHSASIPILRECLSLYRQVGDRDGEAWSLFWLGKGLVIAEGAHGLRQLEEAVVLFRELHQPFGLAWSLINLANSRLIHGDHGRVVQPLEDAAAVAREHGLQGVLGSALAELGAIQLRNGHVDLARDQLREAIDLQRAAGDRYNLGSALTQAGWAELAAECLDRAEAFMHEAVEVSLEVDDEWQQCDALVGLSMVALERGEYGRAQLLLAATGWDVAPPWGRGLEDDAFAARALRQLAQRLPEGFDEAAEEGRRLGAEEVARAALAAPAKRSASG